MAESVIETGAKLILIVQSLDVLQRPTSNDARGIRFLSKSIKELAGRLTGAFYPLP
jgi:hypothetical protein